LGQIVPDDSGGGRNIKRPLHDQEERGIWGRGEGEKEPPRALGSGKGDV